MKTLAPVLTKVARRKSAAVVEATHRLAGAVVSQHLAQRNGARRAHESPRMAAQRVQLEAAFGPAAQREAVPQEEELQVAYRNTQVNRGRLRPAGLLTFQRVVGNRMVQRMVAEADDEQQAETADADSATTVQTKLTASAPDGVQTQGADRVAGQVLTLPEAAAQRPNRSGLPDGLKSGVESLSGMSMDSVKVHYNSSRPAQLNALAYTQGSDIHVAPGQERHLPHEAWHVVQQAQGRVWPTMQMKDGVPVNDEEGLEHEADVMGGRAAQLKRGMHDSRPGPAPEAVVQRMLAAPPGATADMAAIATHRDSIQDTGRTFHEEAAFLARTATVIEPKDDAFFEVFLAYQKATKGKNPVAARAAIDALVLAGNAKYAVFVGHVAALRAKYEDISDQLQEYVKGIPFPPGFDDKLMEEAARRIRQMAFRADDAEFVRHLYEFQEWMKKETDEGYGYAYNDWLATTKAGEPEPPEAVGPAAKPGVMTMSQLRAVAPIGTTAGQRYTPNVAWNGTHTYHVSVSFSLDQSKANLKLKPPRRKLEITNFHVTYTDNANPNALDDQKPRYWWKRTGPGTFVYNNPSGPGQLHGMLLTAQAAVTTAAAAIGCTA